MHYYIDEALLSLPDVVSLVDRSRQYLTIRTADGLEMELVIARVPLAPEATLASRVEKDIAEQRRSFRGFELLSVEERTYEAMVGIEVRMRFIDAAKGPLFHHELHSLVGSNRIGFHGVAKVMHADACDAWMRTMLAEMTPRR
jgi:hypothetical protein